VKAVPDVSEQTAGNSIKVKTVTTFCVTNLASIILAAKHRKPKIR
jgi:hypothetical protein